MKEFVAYIVKNLVDFPDQVRVSELAGANSTILEISVAKPDIGKVIGRQGKTISSLRTLSAAVASRMGVRISIEILEDKEEAVVEAEIQM